MDDVLFSYNVARGVGNVDVDAVLQQVARISNVFARGRTLFDFVLVYSGSKLRTGGEV